MVSSPLMESGYERSQPDYGTYLDRRVLETDPPADGRPAGARRAARPAASPASPERRTPSSVAVAVGATSSSPRVRLRRARRSYGTRPDPAEVPPDAVAAPEHASARPRRCSPTCPAPCSVPGDPGYDEARRVANAAIDRRPAAIVRPVDAAGVARAVLFARDAGLPARRPRRRPQRGRPRRRPRRRRARGRPLGDEGDRRSTRCVASPRRRAASSPAST